MILPVGNIWKEVKVGQDPYFFAAAGDIQAKPTPVSGGFAFLSFFYSGAVRGLLLDRSPQAIYIIVRTCCGLKTVPSDFHYVISGLASDPKSARFFTFSVVKSKLLIRFEKIRRPQARDIISQNPKKICDVFPVFILS